MPYTHYHSPLLACPVNRVFDTQNWQCRQEASERTLAMALLVGETQGHCSLVKLIDNCWQCNGSVYGVLHIVLHDNKHLTTSVISTHKNVTC